MKTAEELFRLNICYSYETAGGDKWEVTDLVGVKKILTEHDKEIINKINDIKNKYCLDKWFSKDDVNDILSEVLVMFEEK